jgi:hypothetical protein
LLAQHTYGDAQQRGIPGEAHVTPISATRARLILGSASDGVRAELILRFTATDDRRARLGADDGRRPAGGHRPMTLAWQFLAQRGYRPLRPGEAPTDAPETWCLRELYLQHYGFAILDDATVQVLAPYAPIVAVGAGSGYWAYELRQTGVEVVATDPGTGRYHGLNRWVPWLPIARLTGVQAVRQYPDHTLLLVWPDYGQRWVSKTLRAYRGETVL